MNRRQFLGAAAAVHGLPTSTPGGASTQAAESSGNDTELSQTVFFELGDLFDDAPTTRVEAYPADPTYAAGLVLETDYGCIRSEIDADRAERIGRELIAAAREGR